MTTAQPDYGTLAPLVQVVGWLISATTAITFSWKRRAKWEPAEEDVSQAPARVGGVLTAALVAVLWTQLADKHEAPLTLRLIVWFGCFTLASLLAYSFVISTLIYKEKYSPAANQVAERLIIGGFLLTAPARAEKKERNLTVQEIFDRGAYNKDRIWNPASRALSKLLFILLYLGLTVCGTALLTCASILLLYPR